MKTLNPHQLFPSLSPSLPPFSLPSFLFFLHSCFPFLICSFFLSPCRRLLLSLVALSSILLPPFCLFFVFFLSSFLLSFLYSFCLSSFMLTCLIFLVSFPLHFFTASHHPSSHSSPFPPFLCVPLPSIPLPFLTPPRPLSTNHSLPLPP